MKIIDYQITNPDQWIRAEMKSVIVIWTELPDTVSIYHGYVNPYQFEVLNICHGHYINSGEEPSKMISWFCNPDGGLLLTKGWNLVLQKQPVVVECATVFEVGFLL